MANKEIVYTDRLVNVSLQGGMVRLDLAVMAGQAKTKDDKPAIKMDITHQVVMTLDAFVAAVGTQQNVLKQLAARQQKAQAEQASAAEAAPAPAAQ
jgi:hypothetical protein